MNEQLPTTAAAMDGHDTHRMRRITVDDVRRILRAAAIPLHTRKHQGIRILNCRLPDGVDATDIPLVLGYTRMTLSLGPTFPSADAVQADLGHHLHHQQRHLVAARAALEGAGYHVQPVWAPSIPPETWLDSLWVW